MKNPFNLLLVIFLAFSVRLSAKEEFVQLYADRRVAIAVPDGFTFEKNFAANGVVTIRLGDPQQQLSLQISLFPDLAGQFSRPRARVQFMVEEFNKFVVGSVEKAMQFQELHSRSGSGTFCVFTDASLVGKTELPPNEFRNVTAGLKAWEGCAASFELYSNDTASKSYEAAMKILTESVHDKPRQATL